MGLPEEGLPTPPQDADSKSMAPPTIAPAPAARPALRQSRGVKRRSDDDLHAVGHRSKTRHIEVDPEILALRRSQLESTIHECIKSTADDSRFDASAIEAVEQSTQYVNVREMVDAVVTESLRSGGRPESSVITPTENGQIIEAQLRLSDGTTRNKTIVWTVMENVPEYVLGKS
jgi:hypothetical protein